MKLSIGNIETDEQRKAVKKFLEVFSENLNDAGYTCQISGVFEVTAEWVTGAACPQVVRAFRNSFPLLEDEEIDSFFDSVPKVESDHPELTSLLDGILNTIVVVNDGMDPVWDTIETLAGHIGESLEAIRQLQEYFNEVKNKQDSMELALKYLFSTQPNAEYDSFLVQSELTTKNRGELQ